MRFIQTHYQFSMYTKNFRVGNKTYLEFHNLVKIFKVERHFIFSFNRSSQFFAFIHEFICFNLKDLSFVSFLLWGQIIQRLLPQKTFSPEGLCYEISWNFVFINDLEELVWGFLCEINVWRIFTCIYVWYR